MSEQASEVPVLDTLAALWQRANDGEPLTDEDHRQIVAIVGRLEASEGSLAVARAGWDDAAAKLATAMAGWGETSRELEASEAARIEAERRLAEADKLISRARGYLDDSWRIFEDLEAFLALIQPAEPTP